VLPSDYGETWGLVVNEAMVCGLPSIVSDRVGCGPDLVEEGVTGGVFPFGDVDALARKLQEFASEPGKLAQMGEQAKERIKNYSVENAVKATMGAIKFVTSHQRPATDEETVDTPRTSLSQSVSSPTARASVVFRPPSSPRVLHVIPSLSPNDGGPSVAMLLIARGLRRAGILADVATTIDSEDSLNNRLEQRATIDGVNYYSFRRQTRFYKVSFNLSNWLSKHIRDYDLIHIHALFSYSSYAAARIARKNGVPYIVRPLGVLNRWGMQNRRRLLKKVSLRFIEQPILRNAAAIHFTSRQEKSEAHEAGVRTSSAVIPLAVELPPGKEQYSSERFYELFPTARDRKIILFLSRIDPKKGLDLLLRAFADLIESEQSTISNERPLLVIAGDGEEGYVGSLKTLAADLKIANEVLWIGFLGGLDKLSALAAARLFVLPSHSENFGIAAVEALAAGVPCVISDQVGIAAEVDEWNAGLVVSCDEVSVSSAIRRLLDDPHLRGILSRNAGQLVTERFSLEAMTESIVELYDKVLSTRSAATDRPIQLNTNLSHNRVRSDDYVS